MDIEQQSINSTLPTECRNAEQYFFSDNFINDLVSAFEYISKDSILCLCTPAVAAGFNLKLDQINDYNVDEPSEFKYLKPLCLDFDSRFEYLPNFFHFDLLNPSKALEEKQLKSSLSKIEYIIFDPPFFQIKLNELRKAIDSITNNNLNTKILIAFCCREEKNLLYAFKEYKLQKTKLKVQYQNVDSSKWSNYGIYSNFELGKIKFDQSSISYVSTSKKNK